MGKTQNQNSSQNESRGSTNPESLWIFGYGSILWQTGFKYNVKKIGHIKGFQRVFWQGNTTHRGTLQQPGRVATLVPCTTGEVWGAAYQLTDPDMIEDALQHLHSRECTLGGYTSTRVTFHPRDCTQGHTITTLTFLAEPHNDLWLGSGGSFEKQAQQIMQCSGPNGTNVEYVLFVAWFMRRYIPQCEDSHLDELEKAVRQEMQKHNKTESDMTRPHLKPENLVF